MKIIYHANCADGFCAAYLFWKKYRPEHEYIPMNYGTVLDYSKFSSEDVIYLLDFSFKKPVLLDLSKIVNHITILDHHKTAAEELSGDMPYNVTVHFDMARSGAAMASDYLSLDRHTIVDYVQDRDLWQWKLPFSRAVNAYIYSLPFEFEEWDRLFKTEKHDIIISGEAITKMLDKQIADSVRNGAEYMLKGTFVTAVNCTNNFSEVAGQLAEKSLSGIGVAWFVRKDGKYQYSLRSRSDVDCSVVAKQFGGGGHKNAAGFESDSFLLIENIISKTIKIPNIGYAYILGYAQRGNTFFNTDKPSGDYYLACKGDEKGNKIESETFYITVNEMKEYLNG